MRRYQRAGVVRPDLPASWLAGAFTSLAVALIDEGEPANAGIVAAADRLAETFLNGASAR
jgi:hypothetical protein